MKKNNSKSENPLNINQSTYELIPKIKELSKTMSQKEVQEKLKINKKTLKKIKDAENINFRTTYLPFGVTPKKSIPYAERYTAKEKSEMYQKRKSNETEDDILDKRERDKKISGLELTDTLKNYAQTGSEYTKILNQIIRQNRLTDFEPVKLVGSVKQIELSS